MAKLNAKISLLNSHTVSEKNIDFRKLQPLNDDELYAWWHIGPGARHFIHAVAEAADKNCATAAHLPKVDTAGFLQIIENKIRRRHVSLLVETLDFDGKGDLEDFTAELTEKFAPNFLRDFTEDSPLTDLSRQNVLSGRVVIVRLKNKFSHLTSAVADLTKKIPTQSEP